MIKRLISKVNTDQNLKELVTGSAVTFVLKMVGMGLGYVVVYLISQKNGATGVGFYSLINQLLMLLGVIASLGMNISVLRFVGQYNNEDDAPQMRNLYSKILSLALPVSLAIGAIVYFSAPWIAAHLLANKFYQNAVELTALALPFFVLNMIGVEYIRGLKRLKISEFIRSVSRPLMIIVALLLFWQDDIPDIYIIYFFILAIMVNSVLSNGTILAQLLRINKPKTHQLSNKELLRVSTPMMITAISSTLIAAISLFFIEYYYTTKEVGVYGVSVRLSQFIAIVLLVVNTIAAPKFSELFWSNKREELQKVLRQSAKLTFWGSLLISVAVAVGAKWILGVFGDDFIEGQWALIILIGGQLINGMTGSVALILNMSGNQAALRNIALISLLAQCGLSIWLIPGYGVIGAAIGASISLSIWNLLCTLYVKRKLGFKTYYIPLIDSLITDSNRDTE